MDSKMTIENVPLATLHDHPRQFDFFAAATESELQELAADLEQRGKQEAIHVCPDGTIIRGHRRVAAARLLAWKTIKAVIRHDLADPVSETAIRELITDNLMRQQLDDLALARCYHALKHRGGTDEIEAGDVRDRLAARLKTGKSGRTMDRLERLLQLPRDIQDMISSNLLNKHQAENILRLPELKQNTLFADLRRGERVSDVLRRYGVIKPVTRKSTADVGEELLGIFHNNLKTLNLEIKALDRLQIRGGDVVKVLDEAAKFLSAWRDRKHLLNQEAVDGMKARVPVRQRPDKMSGNAR